MTGQHRITQLEAACAAMREVLRDAQMHIEADNIDWARFQEGPDHDPSYKPVFPEIVARCAKALSTDAGKSLLDRLQSVEKERDLLVQMLDHVGYPEVSRRQLRELLQPAQKERYAGVAEQIQNSVNEAAREIAQNVPQKEQ